jgi:hypothetical protein
VNLIAVEIGNGKLAYKAKRNIYITYGYALLLVLYTLLPEGFLYLAMFYSIIWFVLNVSVFMSCYMRISYEGADDENDEDGTDK